ncbi:H3 protein, partial [Brachypteracias leptosomus]|nr:H3 protein [Brachypteracias leptosomus]
RAPPLWKKLRLRRRKPRGAFSAAAFHRLLGGFAGGPRRVGVQGPAVAALREGCEGHLLVLLEEWGLCALHAGRASLRAADLRLVRCLRGGGG